MKNKKICAITGKSFEDFANGRTEIYYKNADKKFAIHEKIEKLIENGVTDFICNAAYGVPLFAAEYIIALRDDCIERHCCCNFRLHIVRTYEGQALNWDYDVQDRYYCVCDDADSEFVMYKGFREKCYENSERPMIDCCDFLLTDDMNDFAAQYSALHGKPIVVCEDLEYDICVETYSF